LRVHSMNAHPAAGFLTRSESAMLSEGS
jgi:hypothetical protein